MSLTEERIQELCDDADRGPASAQRAIRTAAKESAEAQIRKDAKLCIDRAKGHAIGEFTYSQSKASKTKDCHNTILAQLPTPNEASE